jgi:hypothetical protein
MGDFPLDLAEQVRAEHNGIMGVTLFLGHDGHNVCTLTDYDGEVGKGESGYGMTDAIRKALSDFRYRSLSSGAVAGREAVEVAIEAAIKAFGDKGDGLFNTAGFQGAINAASIYRLTDSDVVKLLSGHRQLVRLAGGAHWLRLPHQHYRYEAGATAPSNR